MYNVMNDTRRVVSLFCVLIVRSVSKREVGFYLNYSGLDLLFEII